MTKPSSRHCMGPPTRRGVGSPTRPCLEFSVQAGVSYSNRPPLLSPSSALVPRTESLEGQNIASNQYAGANSGRKSLSTFAKFALNGRPRGATSGPQIAPLTSSQGLEGLVSCALPHSAGPLRHEPELSAIPRMLGKSKGSCETLLGSGNA